MKTADLQSRVKELSAEAHAQARELATLRASYQMLGEQQEELLDICTTLRAACEWAAAEFELTARALRSNNVNGADAFDRRAAKMREAIAGPGSPPAHDPDDPFGRPDGDLPSLGVRP